VALTDLQVLVDDLAQRLDAPTVLEDHEQRMVAYSSHSAPIDDVRRDSILRRDTSREVKDWFRQFGIVGAWDPVRIPSHPRLGILGRLCAPVRFRGRLMGFLFLIDDDQRLGETEVAAVVQAQRHAGLLLYEEELAQRLSASVLTHLLSPSIELREVAARQLVEEGLAAADAPHVVVCLRTASASVTGLQEPISEALWELGRRRPAGLLQTASRDHGVLLVRLPEGEDERLALTVAREARELVAHRLAAQGTPDESWTRIIAGIGDPQRYLTAAAVSYRQAMLAARVAATVPSVGDLPQWRDLGAFRALVQLPPGETAESCLDPRLVTLLHADEALLQTLETYLDLAGDVKRTSERLHLHRATLYYRLDKVRRLTGADLSDGNDRLSLHLGFKLARMTGRYPPSNAADLG
jgi:PucR C-terminal helix-turn-helix domain/GGDEF-like domain